MAKLAHQLSIDICKALGLNPNNVKSLAINLWAGGNSITAVLDEGDGDEVAEVFRRYKIVEEKPDADPQ